MATRPKNKSSRGGRSGSGAAEKKPGRRSSSRPGAGRAAKTKTPPRVRVWIDDPQSGLGQVEIPAPDPSATPLGFRITGRTPPAGLHSPGTAAFRFWSAAAALRRAADLWAPWLAHHGVTQWHGKATLEVSLEAGDGLDASYDRKQLEFLLSGTGKSAIRAGESPDILCHETGHACLDALRPDLWDAPFIEVAAFHESFADISALLAALRLPEVRQRTAAAVASNVSSPLSRIAEQLGTALRRRTPAWAEKACLRDAVNTWEYTAPESLPDGPSADALTAEPHSFSRVFTGAFHDLLSAMLLATSPKPTADDLEAAALAAARLLVDATRIAPLEPAFFARIGESLIDVDARVFKGRYAQPIADVLRRRRILPTTVPAGGHPPPTRPTKATRRRMVDPRAAGSELTIDAEHFGLDTEGILVRVPATVSAARARGAVGGETLATRAADRFVAGLFANRRMKLPPGTQPKRFVAGTPTGDRRPTHVLARTDGHMRLRRLRFECASPP